MLRKCLFSFVAIVMIFILCSCGSEEVSPPDPSSGIIFPDSNLETQIRWWAIYKPEGPIHPFDFEELTSLDIEDENIADLSGLQYCSNLTELKLTLNQISDILPLVSLTNLTTLDFTWNKITDISSLASLTSLNSVDLKNNQISDIRPLISNSGLSMGDSVNLSGNPLSDMSVDVYVPKLEKRGVEVILKEELEIIR